jgi:hypothetical protein
MNYSLWLFRLGAVGLFLTFLALGEEPMAATLRQQPGTWPSVAVLFGFPVLLGFLALVLSAGEWDYRGGWFSGISNAAALLTVLWIVLWCFVWLAIVANLGEKAEMFIKHMAYLHLFGVGFTMAAYFTGFMAATSGQKIGRFWMACGWGASYMAFFNLYLQPSLQALWAPAVGGLMLCLGAYFVSRNPQPKVEPPPLTA